MDMCYFALSYYTDIGSLEEAGYIFIIVGTTFSIKKLLYTSLIIEGIRLVSNVPVSRFLLFLFAASLNTSAKFLIFPSKVSFPNASNLGRATTVKNVTLGIIFLLLQVLTGSDSAG